MTPFDPRLTMIAAEAKVKTCHVFHCWHAIQASGQKFHRAAFAHFAGLEDKHVTAILSALEAHDAMPVIKGRGVAAKTMMTADWQWPAVDELSPQAKSCAQQWTPASYATHAEAFRNYWLGARRMMGDWKATWANRVVSIHSQVMRDQKFGNAPTLSPFQATAKPDPRKVLEQQLMVAERHGQIYEADIARRKLAALDNVIPFPQNDSLFESKLAV